MKQIFFFFGFVLNMGILCEAKELQQTTDKASKVDSLLNVLFDGPFYTDFDKSINILAAAQKLAEKHELSAKLAEVYINRCWLAQNFADLALMKSELEKAKPIIASIPMADEPVLIGDYYYTEAAYLTRIGDFIGANLANGKILTLPIEDSLLLHDTYNSIGYNFRKVGNPSRALENFEKALQYNPRNQAEYLVAQSLDLQSIGLSYLDYFNYSKDSSLLYTGVKYLQKALSSIEKAQSTYLSSINESAILNNLSKALLQLNKPDSAALLLDRARTHHLEGYAFLYFIEMNYGEILMSKKDYAGAIAYFLKAKKIAIDRYERTDFYVINNYTKLSEAYLKAGKINKAEEILDAGLAAIKVLEDDMSAGSFANLILPFETARSKVVYEKQITSNNPATLDETIDQYLKTMELVREVRKIFPDRIFKEFLSSDGKQLAARAIDLCYRGYEQTKQDKYLEQAFRFSEESRALTLLESTIENNAISFAGIPDSIIQKGVRLRRALAAVEIAIKAETGSRADLESINRAFETYIDQLEKDYPQYYELKYDVKIPDTKTIASSLSADEQILQYFWNTDFTFLISISPNHRKFEKLSSIGTLEVNQLLYCLQTNPLDQISSNPYETFTDKSNKVYRQLLQDQIEESTQELVIIPDGALHLVPFDILVANNDQLLIEKYTISYDVSVSLMQYRYSGNNSSKDSYVGFAPQYNGEKTVQLRSDNSPENNGRFTLGKLRYNESEVKALKENLGGSYYLGNGATKSSFLSLAERNKVFHLSAHGLYNDRAPLNSAIYFSQQDTGLYKNENALFAFEVYGRKINAELGILSSCESGFGKYQSGEGLNSLRRAFYFAGCKSIVSSLWNANDRATYQIIEEFGKNLSAGKEKNAALRLAKLSFLNENESTFGHPYFWAHLTLSGDTAAIVQEAVNYWWWIASLITVLILVALIIKMKR